MIGVTAYSKITCIDSVSSRQLNFEKKLQNLTDNLNISSFFQLLILPDLLFVPYRQLGFRAMMLFQGLFLTIAILEISVVPKHYWSDSYAVAKYSPYTGFATLFIGTSMVLNIFVVVTVFANTYGYLPPKAKHLIGSDVELSLLTTSTHVHKVFSLYTAYWMCAGSILAYTYVENVIKLRKERKKAMKKV
ncbi:hypothetical protein SARC_09915 [Sphaeroforma arctica JP610]|uniref:Uncharacterized protein n=1 Tax=Sphaeroforma arctica JP610 TaxID=667725 RepID=A0A0L0FLH5_9EUKA|nr:hypothetical protein SARC_09915 [Sphaeroforma arctica JP610]KNC77627.1 hypothetical protein SARC_09915 [Sphaeroforma arctica JP610]|eukprot:XP_014151529.1 hypothetical protein SARC_09915 [Sphaeroforma arctica JP610]